VAVLFNPATAPFAGPWYASSRNRGDRPNYVSLVLQRHIRASRIHERGGKVYAIATAAYEPIRSCVRHLGKSGKRVPGRARPQ
jgi:hypothetical protein